MLEALQIGVIAFPGTGTQDNLAGKARMLGIPVFNFRRDRYRQPVAVPLPGLDRQAADGFLRMDL